MKFLALWVLASAAGCGGAIASAGGDFDAGADSELCFPVLIDCEAGCFQGHACVPRSIVPEAGHPEASAEDASRSDAQAEVSTAGAPAPRCGEVPSPGVFCPGGFEVRCQDGAAPPPACSESDAGHLCCPEGVDL